MKAMNFENDAFLFPKNNFTNQYALGFELTSMQYAIENCYYSELVGEPIRLELNFIYTLEQVTELIVLEEPMSSVAFDIFVLLEIRSEMDNVSLQHIINRIPLLKYRYLGSFPSDYVPTRDKDTFANINT